MTPFSTTYSITPAEQDLMEARARKLRSKAFRQFFSGLFIPRSR